MPVAYAKEGMKAKFVGEVATNEPLVSPITEIRCAAFTLTATMHGHRTKRSSSTAPEVFVDEKRLIEFSHR